MWTIQEAVLSADKLLFHCGKREIPFFDIWDVFCLLQGANAIGLLLPEIQDPFDAQAPPQAFLQITLIVGLQYEVTYQNTEYVDSFGLEEAILHCSRALATNPRDHIYGVYGIVSDATDEELKADYGAPVEEIYVKTTKYLISRNKSLRLLSDSGIYAPSRLDVPSWVPNYNSMSICQTNASANPCQVMNIKSNILLLVLCPPRRCTLTFYSTARINSAGIRILHSIRN